MRRLAALVLVLSLVVVARHAGGDGGGRFATMALGFVLSGSLLTEIVFSYPGLGYLLVQAVRNQDYALIQGLFLLITLAVLAANFLVDVTYVWLDPRTRAHA